MKPADLLYFQLMESKYKVGDIVHSKANPVATLVVRRYVDGIYYCASIKHPNDKELAFSEKELV